MRLATGVVITHASSMAPPTDASVMLVLYSMTQTKPLAQVGTNLLIIIKINRVLNRTYIRLLIINV